MYDSVHSLYEGATPYPIEDNARSPSSPVQPDDPTHAPNVGMAPLDSKVQSPTELKSRHHDDSTLTSTHRSTRNRRHSLHSPPTSSEHSDMTPKPVVHPSNSSALQIPHEIHPLSRTLPPPSISPSTTAHVASQIGMQYLPVHRVLQVSFMIFIFRS